MSVPVFLSHSTIGAAPKPAFTTAATISSSEALPETDISFVRRLTAHAVTPGVFFTARSTRIEQAAQCMPVTENFREPAEALPED